MAADNTEKDKMRNESATKQTEMQGGGWCGENQWTQLIRLTELCSHLQNSIQSSYTHSLRSKFRGTSKRVPRIKKIESRQNDQEPSPLQLALENFARDYPPRVKIGLNFYIPKCRYTWTPTSASDAWPFECINLHERKWSNSGIDWSQNTL